LDDLPNHEVNTLEVIQSDFKHI